MSSATDFSNWIGKSMEVMDLVTPRLVEEYRVTLAPFLAPAPADEAPLGFHWCLSPSLAPMDELGGDGHPRKGGFLPPVPLPRRMWAGGHIDFHGPIKVGDEVRRRCTIASIEMKEGRSGPLCFVGVKHDYLTPRGLALSEQHNIVYREAVGPGGERPASAAPAGRALPPGAIACRVTPSPTLLFRYSAVTFNGHRIHYDRPYATGVEGYDDLVVHGPLQATLMLNRAVAEKGAAASRFSYRGLAPLTSGADFEIVVDLGSERASCWTQRAGGPVNMQGEIQW